MTPFGMGRSLNIQRLVIDDLDFTLGVIDVEHHTLIPGFAGNDQRHIASILLPLAIQQLAWHAFYIQLP